MGVTMLRAVACKSDCEQGEPVCVSDSIVAQSEDTGLYSRTAGSNALPANADCGMSFRRSRTFGDEAGARCSGRRRASAAKEPPGCSNSCVACSHLCDGQLRYAGGDDLRIETSRADEQARGACHSGRAPDSLPGAGRAHIHHDQSSDDKHHAYGRNELGEIWSCREYIR